MFLFTATAASSAATHSTATVTAAPLSSTSPRTQTTAVSTSSPVPSGVWEEHRRLFGFQSSQNGQPPRKRASSSTRSRTSQSKETKKAKEPTWTRKFVCLHNTKAKNIPTTSEYLQLRNASLGEMKITFLQSDSCHNVDKKLKDAFPKLESAGGYTLARSITTRDLQKIEPPYSVFHLKDSTGQGKIFIIPLQRNLDLTPTVKLEGHTVRK